MEKTCLILFALLSYATCVKFCGENTYLNKNQTYIRNFNNKISFVTDPINVNNNKIFNFLNMRNSFPDTFLPIGNNTSDSCRKHSNIVYQSAKLMQLWALKMYDSSAKLPSGILNGNINQYGDYDQCMSIDSPIKSKYCLASLDISFKTLVANEDIDNLIHSHHWIRSNLTDFGHRVPKVSMIYWGVCLPASCSAKELEDSMKHSLNHMQANVVVDENLCAVRDDAVSMDVGKIITVIIFTIIVLSVSIGTAFDVKDYDNTIPNGKIRGILESFSLRRNVEVLLCTNSKEEIAGLDGIRGLNAVGLLLSHKSFSLFFNPFINRTYMAEVFSKPWAVIGRTAIIYTDSFLLISGFLSAHNLLKDLKDNGSMNFSNKFINRIFRILPNFMVIILFCTYLLPDMGSGPLWGIIINEHSRLCKRNMWNNFLFIHNYMGFENMCLTHTHQLGIDMQLFIVTPIAVWLLWKFKTNGAIILLILAIASSLLRLFVSLTKHLSMVVYFGKSVSDFWDSANYSYILPTHRATIYIIGIGLAYFMTLKQSKLKLSTIRICWFIAIGLGLIASLGPMEMTLLNYKLNITKAAMYNTFSPIIWGIFVSWVIWACNNGSAGIFGVILSWRGFKIFSKISYGVYLVQFPVFFYSVGLQRHADYYNFSKMINIPEFIIIFMLSTVLTLCVEMPFINVRRVLSNTAKSKNCDINQNSLKLDTVLETTEVKNISNYDAFKKIM